MRLPFFAEFVTQSIFFCASQVVVACGVYPWFSIALVMLLTVFFISDKCMSKGIFEARKLDNQTKSSVVHSLSSVLSGVRIIRGFERESLFQKRYLFFATVLHYTILILYIYTYLLKNLQPFTLFR